jgi:endo-1,3(4)-beta-glucanase
MWGSVTGDANMEARGSLMLALQARSLTNYFLMQSNNTNQPAQFIGNKASGILFENKVDRKMLTFGPHEHFLTNIR